MRSFITLFAFAAAATAATSPLVAREDAASCAMKTLLSSSACNTGDAACLCSDAARKSVMQEIKSSCGAETSDATDKLASEACSSQKMRRATTPSGTSSSASASSSAAERLNGAQEGSDGEACTCANTKNSANTPAAAGDEVDDETDAADPDAELSDTDSNTDSPTGADPISHGSNTEDDSQTAASSRVHAAATSAAVASSSAVHHGAVATPTNSLGALPTPSGADPFAQFQGAGAQVVPSLSFVLAGVVGAFAAL